MSSTIARTWYMGGYDLGVTQRVEVREGFSKHELAIIDYPSPRNLSTSVVPEMTPMTLQWGESPQAVRTFYGYVNHHEIVETGDTSMLRVFCLGTSLPMNDPNPSSWSQVSASFIAKTVAARHGLRSILHQSKTVLPYWAQGTESDFAMMNRLADTSGYRFWVDGSTLYFLNPDVLIRTPQTSFVPVFTMNRDGRSVDSLQSIYVIAGSLAPTASAATIQEVYGIDANTGALIKSSSAATLADRGMTAPSQRTIAGKSVDSLAEARVITDASASLGSWVTTQVSLNSASMVHPGDLVNLQGAALHTDYQGYWLVSHGIHVISQDVNGAMTLLSDMELTRNQADHALFTLSSTLKSARAEVPAVLRNGKQWESEVLESVYA